MTMKTSNLTPARANACACKGSARTTTIGTIALADANAITTKTAQTSKLMASFMSPFGTVEAVSVSASLKCAMRALHGTWQTVPAHA